MSYSISGRSLPFYPHCFVRQTIYFALLFNIFYNVNNITMASTHFCDQEYRNRQHINNKLQRSLALVYKRCTNTSDLRHFEPKTFQHHGFGAEVSQIFALVPKCLSKDTPAPDTSAPVPKCIGHFGTKVHETLRTQN